MTCEQYREQFTDFLENSLEPQEWRALEEHLRACPDCAAQIKAFRRTVSALRGLETVEPPRHFLRTLRERLEQPEVIPPAPVRARLQAQRVRRPFNWQTAGTLAAACLVLLLAVAYNFRAQLGLGLTSRAESGGMVAAPATESVSPATLPQPAAAPAGLASAPAPAGSGAPAERAPADRARPRLAPGRAADRPSSPSPALTQPGVTLKSGTPPATEGLAMDNAPPAGPAGPAAPPAPAAAAPETGRVAFGGGAAAGATPRVMAAAAAAPVKLDLSASPPGTRVVGQWGTLRVSVKADRDVPAVSVRLSLGEGLQAEDGAGLYRGALSAGSTLRLGARLRATSPGTHRLQVVLDSATPGASTSLPVVLEGYREAEHAADGLTRRSFRSVSLAEAARAVAADCGLAVQLDPALAGRRVTADFSAGVSGSHALGLLARLADGKVERRDGAYALVPTS